MLMSNLAVMDLGLRRRSMLERLRDVFRRANLENRELPNLFQEQASRPALSIVADAPKREGDSEVSGDYRWRRHPQLLDGSAASSITDNERRARKTAVRGLYCAHNGDVEEAFLHFARAIDEARIDLTEMPSFWQMPRGAILAAAEAYEGAGRYREASVIQARVRTELRPRNVVPMRRLAASPALRSAANGS